MEEKTEWLQTIKRLVSESVQPDRFKFRPDVPLCTLIHSHHNFAEIFFYAWKRQVLPRGKFADHVFRLVMLHQSIPVLSAYPPATEMTAKEIINYCEPQFMALYAIFVTADSNSYSIFAARNGQASGEEKRQEIF